MRDPLSMAAAADLEALSSVARALEPVAPHERRAVLRQEAALLLDGLLVRVARGRGALDLAIGDGLASLTVGDRLLRLGFSCLGDYSRERLGLAGSTAQKLERLARNLAQRSLLREAVRSGSVSARKAETVVALAHGEAEAAWVARARVETVRALAAAVTASGGGEGTEEAEERWERVVFASRSSSPGTSGPHEKLDQALALAGKALGAAAPRWQRLEALCEEYLGAHPDPLAEEAPGAAGPVFDHAPSGRPLEELRSWLEVETKRWAFIASFDPAPAPEPGPGAAGGTAALEAVASGAAETGSVVDLARLDAGLRQLRDLRSRWDEVFGHLAMLLRQLGLWRDMQFTDFGHYCAERLGLSERAVSQRASLERRLYDLPALRAAMRDGRVTYEKARIVAACADERTLETWIARASRLPCIALAREAEAQEEAQMCARGEFTFRLPLRVASLLESALRAARAASGRWITPAEALGLVAEHFIATWEPQLRERNTVQKRVLARDRDWCQVPGCSRAALQAHHVRFRSHHGPTVGENLTSLCAAHHLHGVHAGYIRVVGVAPDRLRWTFRPGGGPAVVEAPRLATA